MLTTDDPKRAATTGARIGTAEGRSASRSPRAREALAALGVFTAGALLYLGPAMRWRLAGSLGPDHGDPLLYVYLLKWFAHSLSTGFAGYWDPPFFHPLKGVLAFSDHLIGPSVAFTALRGLGAAPLAAYNFLYASQFVAAGWVLWWVLRRSGASFAGAAVGGWLFAFGHFRWEEQSHFNVLLIAAVPLVLWSFDRLLEAPSAGRVAVFLAGYYVHLSGGTYLAYLVHVPLAILAALRARGLFGLVRREPRRLVSLATAAALAALPLAFLFVGYSTRTAELQAERHVWELRSASSVLASFVSASPGSPLDRFADWLPGLNGRGALFPGFVAAALVATALLDGWRRLRRPIVRRSRAVAAIGWLGATLIFAALLAGDHFTIEGEPRWLGIDLHGYRGPLWAALVGAALLVWTERWRRNGPIAAWERVAPWSRGLLSSSAIALLLCLPTFYWLLWAVLPGMRGTRVSHRFFAFAAVGIAFLAARGFDRLRAAVPSRVLGAALGAMLAGVVVVECSPRLRAWTPLAEEERFPGYAVALASADDVAAYLQLPIFGDWRDLRAMYLGTAHWRPLVNGSTSFEPRHYAGLTRDCSNLQQRCLAELRRHGVSHIALSREVDRNLSPRHSADAAERRRLAARAVRRELDLGTLVEVYADDSGSLYRLVSPAEASARDGEHGELSRSSLASKSGIAAVGDGTQESPRPSSPPR